MLSVILLILAGVFLFYWKSKKTLKTGKYKFPDGPKGIPILGNLLQVLVHPHLQFSKWAYKYGNIYALRIARHRVLVINNAQTMKQVLGTMESTGRFNFEMLDQISEGVNGIMSAEGSIWQELRIFIMKALKECGIWRSSVIEPIVLQEGQRIVEWIENEAKKNPSSVVTGFRNAFIQSTSNYTWSILNRETDGASSSEMGMLVLNFIDMLNVTTNSGLLFFPWLKYIVPEWSGHNGYVESCANIHKQVQIYFDKRIEERQHSKIDPESRNLLDAFLDEWENCKDPNSCFYEKAGWKQCFYSVVQILIASVETQAGTLNWLINYLVANPKIQENLHEELNKVLGSDRAPTLADKPKLPYLEAVILETLRMSSVVPMGVMHRLLDDTQFGEYIIPKDTLLIANIYHANWDKSIWNDADVFRPERFLEVDSGEKARLKENIASFQPGKRVCPGENMGKDAIFLLVATLVQKFKFLSAPGKTASDYADAVPGYILLPKGVGIQVEARV